MGRTLHRVQPPAPIPMASLSALNMQIPPPPPCLLRVDTPSLCAWQAARMRKELAMLAQDPPSGISCWAVNDDITTLEVGARAGRAGGGACVGGAGAPHTGSTQPRDPSPRHSLVLGRE